MAVWHDPRISRPPKALSLKFSQKLSAYTRVYMVLKVFDCSHYRLEYSSTLYCITSLFRKTCIVLSRKKIWKKKSTFLVWMSWSGEVVNSLQDLLATRPNRNSCLSQTRMQRNGSWKSSESCRSCCPTRKDLKKRYLQSVCTWHLL